MDAARRSSAAAWGAAANALRRDSGAAGRYPSELGGRTGFRAFHQRSISTFASRGVSNSFWVNNSSRSFSLKRHPACPAFGHLIAPECVTHMLDRLTPLLLVRPQAAVLPLASVVRLLGRANFRTTSGTVFPEPTQPQPPGGSH